MARDNLFVGTSSRLKGFFWEQTQSLTAQYFHTRLSVRNDKQYLEIIPKQKFNRGFRRRYKLDFFPRSAVTYIAPFRNKGVEGTLRRQFHFIEKLDRIGIRRRKSFG